MIFAARGIMVSLAFFSVVYCLLSLLVVILWRSANLFLRSYYAVPAPAVSANVLFGLRLFPFAVSAGFTVFFTVPSFFMLEKPFLDEDLGTFVLGLSSLLILGAGLLRVVKTQAKTTRAVSHWLAGAGTADAGETATTRASRGAPPLALVGIRTPRVLVSDIAAALLSHDELRVAVRHEVEHLRSRDNLKKVGFSCTPFPGMAGLETAWQEAAELAADRAAVSSRKEALDLAAALIKLARSHSLKAVPAFTTGLLSVSGSVSMRVEHLLAWHAHRAGGRRRYAIFLAGTILLGLALNYGPILALTHRLTEQLVP